MFKFVFVLSCITLCAAVDWCDPKLCGGKKKQHVACIHDGSLGKDCTPGTKLINLDKDKFLNEINSLRNNLALGKVKGYESAVRMGTVEWDEELAEFAVLNVKSCEFEHDKCYNTFKFRNAGQCLAGLYTDPKKDINMTEVILSSADGWFSENKNIDMSYIKHFRVDGNFGKYGHFTEMAVANITHVGCGAIQFPNNDFPGFDRVNVACNFNSIHSGESALYISGPPASKCVTGKNPNYPGLCSVKEFFNPNLYDYDQYDKWRAEGLIS